LYVLFQMRSPDVVFYSYEVPVGTVAIITCNYDIIAGVNSHRRSNFPTRVCLVPEKLTIRVVFHSTVVLTDAIARGTRHYHITR